MKVFPLISCIVFLIACSDPGTEPRPIHVAPNDPAAPRTRPATLTEPSPRPTVRGVEAVTDETVAKHQEPGGDLRLLPLPEQQSSMPVGPSPLATSPNRTGKPNARDPLLDLETQTVRTKPKPTARVTTTKAPAPRRWAGGGAPLPARPQTYTLNQRYSAGTLLRARLLGDLWVSQGRTLVLAAVYDGDEHLGTGLGTANLDVYRRGRVQISINRIIDPRGQRIDGALTALDLDRAEGVVGVSMRKPMRDILLAGANALLGALSLQVDPGGSGLADVFRVQLAEELLQQAQQQVNTVARRTVVHVPRDQSFFLLAAGDLNNTHSDPVGNNGIDALFRPPPAPRRDLSEVSERIEDLVNRLGLPTPEQN